MKTLQPVKVLGALLVFGSLLLAVSLLLLVHYSPLLIDQYFKNRQLQLWRERYAKASKRMEAATADGERFYPLTELATSAFYLGRTNDARIYAERLLAIAPQFQDNWNYGNAIHDGNEVLGWIAVQQGRLDDAKRYLIEAGKTPGSPQLNSFGPDMGLAQELLKRGERETVLQYLKLCRRFWEGHEGLLDRWAQDVKDGKTPDLEEKYE